MEIRLLTKNYNGLFFSVGKYWRGVYVHHGQYTRRFFVSKTNGKWKPKTDARKRSLIFDNRLLM